ncbi:helicase HerA-like domain-containing protein, partial [Cellulosimicrobium funkei]
EPSRTDAPPEPAPTGPARDAPSSPGDGYAAQVAAGYAYTGGTLPLGALLEGSEGGDPSPRADVQVGFALSMLNRHGLVAGATGTGKTKTLQGMAEGLSAAGVPVFLADVKGDLSGLAVPGTSSAKIVERAASIGQDWSPTAYPVEVYSLGGLGTGVPIRTTVADFGPLLLAKVLGLNETQESSLGLIFHWADAQGLALLDLKDLQATIAYLTSDEGKAELRGIGGVSGATAGVILREIVALQAQGADVFFGEPAFATSELLRTTPDGRGVVSALELPAVQDRPALFSTFLMWLLADLFQELPEVGDVEKPRLVFFFDEAHLLFTGASKEFLQQVVQTVRLVRSKGVGVFFVTQSPKDVPADVLAQLGNRVQHALRAFTPDDAAALRAAVRTYPTSPYDLERLLQSLGTGEAVVTVLTEKG